MEEVKNRETWRGQCPEMVVIINGAQRTFQWIMNAAGQINHRFFEPG